MPNGADDKYSIRLLSGLSERAIQRTDSIFSFSMLGLFDLEVCFYCFYSGGGRGAPYNRVTIDI